MAQNDSQNGNHIAIAKERSKLKYYVKRLMKNIKTIGFPDFGISDFDHVI
jgi:hypothetical protein